MRKFLTMLATWWLAIASQTAAQTKPLEGPRPRARDLGIGPGIYDPGPLNSITDVAGVRVGHATLVSGSDVRTGVTAILPHGGNIFREKVAAAVYVYNAFGKLAGSTQVTELGQLETPIILTNTLSVWDAAAALVDWTLAQPGNEDVYSVNPLVGETNDGWLNDIRGRHVKAEDVRRALTSALSSGPSAPVEEGAAGAGTGTLAFGWKGGIGTSSRHLPASRGGYTIGVLVQTNFGGRLTIAGVPVWRELQPPESRASATGLAPPSADGSCMIVVATDAPLDARQLRRLAARAILGMARTGATGSHGSGEFVIAFSTTTNRAAADTAASQQPRTEADSPRGAPGATRRTSVPSRSTPADNVLRPAVQLVDEDHVSPLFEAAIDATEEAIYNSLLRAHTIHGRADHSAEALPMDKLRQLLARPRP
ncbi:MAG TPA: P1 family peptidase [Candidatus Dormibacteraeota bacterium]|nr:P1 family peptidase [Candidatus Dormibacteraeota bacterium]